MESALRERLATPPNGTRPAFLGVSSVDLRRLVGSRPLLADAIYEGTDRVIDEAVQVLLDGLRHPELSKRLVAAAYLLRHTEAGRRRGWGRRRALPEEAAEPRTITLKWLDEGEPN